jgi:hypothetical protein
MKSIFPGMVAQELGKGMMGRGMKSIPLPFIPLPWPDLETGAPPWWGERLASRACQRLSV